ncbi:uncharacterized protein B0I36DRAFT_62537 [Microdochium trichocladiopsis]|uniref:BPL/LPL catalytic domain-containing protein n=1 Tax=Microdochium trichocladiopsis TaxID=1682393 RepID=A0A9P9BXL6_9PEZI|nr:uncharacterized protein B0I36DRAFT_62537 [Microdochium trichocladiopsis]KAH7037168.1 hypothetical protein B0I36DRAFT_62537 [Microdochium trichocladiopsis]
MAAGGACRLASKAAASPLPSSSSPSANTRLRHLRIASSAAKHEYPAYADVERLQSRLQRELLSWKAAASSATQPLHKSIQPGNSNNNSTASTEGRTPPVTPPPSPPLPTLISFTPKPTYTLGRRQTAPLSAAERARLEAPLAVSATSSSTKETATSTMFSPAVISAPRGGLATYHGPGQVVFWPVLDLHSPLHRHFTVRDYACLLEKTTIAALARFAGVRGFTTENPGVWVRHRGEAVAPATAGANGGEDGTGQGDERKISALGVHLRRHVTGLGVAVNFGMPVSGPEETNPWARIVACGLGDKRVTSIAAESEGRLVGLPGLGGGEDNNGDGSGAGHDAVADALADVWAEEFAARLGLAAPEAAADSGIESAVTRVLVAEVDVDVD